MKSFTVIIVIFASMTNQAIAVTQTTVGIPVNGRLTGKSKSYNWEEISMNWRKRF